MSLLVQFDSIFSSSSSSLAIKVINVDNVQVSLHASCVVYATVKVDGVRIENYLCTSMLNINKHVCGFQLLYNLVDVSSF